MVLYCTCLWYCTQEGEQVEPEERRPSPVTSVRKRAALSWYDLIHASQVRRLSEQRVLKDKVLTIKNANKGDAFM